MNPSIGLQCVQKREKTQALLQILGRGVDQGTWKKDDQVVAKFSFLGADKESEKGGDGAITRTIIRHRRQRT